MNISIVLYVLSYVILFEGVFLGLPVLVSVIYQEQAGWSFLVVLLICLTIGYLGRKKKPKNTNLFAREGFIIVALSWVVLSALGALPFYLTREIPSYIDALFETISGFTTTGASILSDVESLSYCTLFWRSFTHWIGGMGVLVFLLAIVPLAGGSNMYIMKAESPGPSVGKLVPRVKDTAVILYGIYLFITVAEMTILIVSGMPIFDAITLSFGTAGTGGFGVKNSSIGDYTMFQQATISIFMILFGVNFNAYFLFLNKKVRQGLKIEEVRWYLAIITASTLYIGWNVRDQFSGLFTSMHHALFQVASIITTTGYSTCDFDQWSSSVKVVLVLLMFVGACAGSTGGGIKVSRIVIMFKTVKKEMSFYVHPRSVKKIHMDGRPIEHEVVRSVNVFLISYIVIFIVSIFLVSLQHTDLVTNFTAVAATLNNIGPGLAGVGPTANFGGLSVLAKIVLMFDMLAGRLELFPMLLLITPAVWKKVA